MNLYHTAACTIKTLDVSRARRFCDFGKGLYFTPQRGRAMLWCRYVERTSGYGSSIIYEFELDDEAFHRISVRWFDTYSEDWLDFVLACRHGSDGGDYDMVWGPLVCDGAFNAQELFTRGLIDKREALKRLRRLRPRFQLCFRGQTVVDECLHFVACGREFLSASPTLLVAKYARVVALFAREAQLSKEEALRVFYGSTTYLLMREGVADLHCMSDGYLVDELMYEYQKKGEGVAMRGEYDFGQSVANPYVRDDRDQVMGDPNHATTNTRVQRQMDGSDGGGRRPHHASLR